MSKSKLVPIRAPQSAISAMVDDKYAWPEGAGAISAWRKLVKDGIATETSGKCEGCRVHRPGQSVPVFELRDGFTLVPR